MKLFFTTVIHLVAFHSFVVAPAGAQTSTSVISAEEVLSATNGVADDEANVLQLNGLNDSQLAELVILQAAMKQEAVATLSAEIESLKAKVEDLLKQNVGRPSKGDGRISPDFFKERNAPSSTALEARLDLVIDILCEDGRLSSTARAKCLKLQGDNND